MRMAGEPGQPSDGRIELLLGSVEVDAVEWLAPRLQRVGLLVDEL